MSDSNSESNPQTTSNTAYTDERVGLDGANNRVLQGGSTDLGGGIFGGSAPIAASTFQDTGDIFNPAFNFSGGGEDDRANAYDLYQNPAYNPGFSGQPGFSQPAGGSAPRSGDFGGAAQTGGVVTGGDVSAPVASGDDSIAQQVTGGAAVAGGNSGQVITAPVAGPVIGGDVEAPIIQGGASGPITAAGGDIGGPVVNAGTGGGVSAPIVAGGDVDISGAAVQGNSGTVNISDASEEIVKAALESNLKASDSALSLAKESLNAGLTAAKDPSEIVSSNAFKTVALVAGVVGLMAWFSQKKAA